MILLYGGLAGMLLAAVEGLFSGLRISKRPLVVAFNSAMMLFSTSLDGAGTAIDVWAGWPTTISGPLPFYRRRRRDGPGPVLLKQRHLCRWIGNQRSQVRLAHLADSLSLDLDHVLVGRGARRNRLELD